MLARKTAVVDRVVTKGAAPIDLCGNDKIVPFPAVEKRRSVGDYNACMAIGSVCLRHTTLWPFIGPHNR